jgi:hypothetical protein
MSWKQSMNGEHRICLKGRNGASGLVRAANFSSVLALTERRDVIGEKTASSYNLTELDGLIPGK